MTELSLAAQAVLYAFTEDNSLHDWKVHIHHLDALAAALRTVADHLPSSAMYPSSDWGCGWRTGINDAKQRLLAIAAELEGQ